MRSEPWLMGYDTHKELAMDRLDEAGQPDGELDTASDDEASDRPMPLSAHTFRAHPTAPAWCEFCPEPKDHPVHEAYEGEG